MLRLKLSRFMLQLLLLAYRQVVGSSSLEAGLFRFCFLDSIARVLDESGY